MSVSMNACGRSRDHRLAISQAFSALTVVGIFCVEAAKNASGEIFDWDSGADQGVRDDERSPFSGGKRVIVDGLLTRRETAIVAGVFYAIAIAVGLAIVLQLYRLRASVAVDEVALDAAPASELDEREAAR